MKFGIISGSQQRGSNSVRIAQLLSDRMSDLGMEVFMRALGEEPLPFWSPDISDPASEVAKAWQPLSAELSSCQGYIFVSPEWHGMVPPALKNFFLFATKFQIAHKPALIVTVSTGVGGSYPAHELRTSSYKNSSVVYLPDQLILRNVSTFLEDYQCETSPITKALKGRMMHLTKMLVSYARALAEVRKDTAIDFSAFPNGM